MNEILTDLASDIEVGTMERHIERVGNIDVTHTTIGDDCAIRRGKYHSFCVENSASAGDVESAIATILGGYLSPYDRVLVVGFGNDEYMCDRLGSATLDGIDIGRGDIATLEPSVVALTGIESVELVRCVAREYCPDIVIAIDTLSTMSMDRLAVSLQMTDAGLHPGAGVGKGKRVVDSELIGAPTIAIGVPLVVSLGGMYLIPSTIEDIVSRYARLLANGINSAVSRIR